MSPNQREASPYADDLRLAHVLADQVERLTMSRFRADDLVVESKPDLSPVSDADRACEEAIRALTQTLCALPAAARGRIAGVNLLGEVHHLYPDFEAGMGHQRPYVLTDYSPASRVGFRQWLRQRFRGDVAALNAYLGASFASFDQLEPPSRDIRRERLDHFWQHLDDAAAVGTS